MNPKVLLFAIIFAVGVIGSKAARMFILDDGDFGHVRHRREEPKPLLTQPAKPLQYSPIPPVAAYDQESAGSDSYGHGGGYAPGRVGPVYTFVKTDPYAHVKWGVRHVAGSQYAGRR